jgi:hypothetical protein
MHEIVKTKCHIRFDKSALEVWNIPNATIERTPIVREESDSTLHDDEPPLGKAASDKYHVVSEREANATTRTNASTSTSTSWGKSAPTPFPSPHTAAESSLDAEDAGQKVGDALKDSGGSLRPSPRTTSGRTSKPSGQGSGGKHVSRNVRHAGDLL